MGDKINEAFKEAFSKGELHQLRKDVQFGRISFVTIIEYGEPIIQKPTNQNRAS